MSLVPLGWSREIWHGGLGVGPVGPVRPSSNLSQSGSCGKRDCLGRWLSSRSNGWNWWRHSINTPSPFSFRNRESFSATELLSQAHLRRLRLPTPPPYSTSLLIILSKCYLRSLFLAYVKRGTHAARTWSLSEPPIYIWRLHWGIRSLTLFMMALLRRKWHRSMPQHSILQNSWHLNS